MKKLLFLTIVCLFSCNLEKKDKKISSEIYLKGSNGDGYVVSVNYFGTEVYYKYTDDAADTTNMIIEAKVALESYKKDRSI